MKAKFDAYVLWPLERSIQNWIVDWSTARNFMVGSLLAVWAEQQAHDD
jgi:hypothetical protein